MSCWEPGVQPGQTLSPAPVWEELVSGAEWGPWAENICGGPVGSKGDREQH